MDERDLADRDEAWERMRREGVATLSSGLSGLTSARPREGELRDACRRLRSLFASGAVAAAGP